MEGREVDYRPRREARPPRLPRPRQHPVVFGIGPEILGRRRETLVIAGPGEPPPGFVTATTSRSEWYVYWALAVIEHDPPDARKPPFFGGLRWDYQRMVLGDVLRAPGSAILDFIFYGPRQRIGLRLVSYYWHIAQSPQTKAVDKLQRARLERAGFRVVDLFEQDFMGDKTGAAVIKVTKEGLGFWERPNPITAARTFARG